MFPRFFLFFFFFVQFHRVSFCFGFLVPFTHSSVARLHEERQQKLESIHSQNKVRKLISSEPDWTCFSRDSQIKVKPVSLKTSFLCFLYLLWRFDAMRSVLEQRWWIQTHCKNRDLLFVLKSRLEICPVQNQLRCYLVFLFKCSGRKFQVNESSHEAHSGERTPRLTSSLFSFVVTKKRKKGSFCQTILGKFRDFGSHLTLRFLLMCEVWTFGVKTKIHTMSWVLFAFLHGILLCAVENDLARCADGL